MESWLKLSTLRRWRRDPGVSQRIAEVLNLRPEDVGQGFRVDEPRSLPGNPEFVRSRWTEHMLLRYLLTLERVEHQRVLDSCCGLGWGSYLVASRAASVVGIDLDEQSIRFCRERWGHSGNQYVTGSVLDLPFPDHSFDAVLCMESIEHFSRADGLRYVQELRRVCRPGGVLFGSSTFPRSRAEAEQLAARNPHHLYIYTEQEAEELLTSAFGPLRRLTRHYVMAG